MRLITLPKKNARDFHLRFVEKSGFDSESKARQISIQLSVCVGRWYAILAKRRKLHSRAKFTQSNEAFLSNCSRFSYTTSEADISFALPEALRIRIAPRREGSTDDNMR